MGKEKRPFFVFKILSPMGCFPLPGAIYMWKNIKKTCINSDFKEMVLKLATNGQSNKAFRLTSTFVPKGLSAPALGLYTCIKTTNVYQDQVSDERLQDYWSSGYFSYMCFNSKRIQIHVMNSTYLRFKCVKILLQFMCLVKCLGTKTLIIQRNAECILVYSISIRATK